MPIRRIAIGLEYDGSHFHGWQRQKAVDSIQARVESALSYVASETVHITCAGRTDKKVHATYQVIHFDTEANRSERAWVFGANTELHSDIRVLWAKEVDPAFNARRTALGRSYRYIIYNHPNRPGLFRNQLSWYYSKLNIELMSEAAKYWIGEHDFSSFRAAECQSLSPIRTVTNIEIARLHDLVMIDFSANAFLHHMVRNMVGVLIEIGKGSEEPQWAKVVLEARDRRSASITADPSGLYLIDVKYPIHFGLPKSTEVGFGRFWFNGDNWFNSGK